MVKLVLSVVVFSGLAAASWTGYRSLAAAPKQTAEAVAVDPLNTEAAYRHRNAQPHHWRGYVLHQNRF